MKACFSWVYPCCLALVASPLACGGSSGSGGAGPGPSGGTSSVSGASGAGASGAGASGAAGQGGAGQGGANSSAGAAGVSGNAGDAGAAGSAGDAGAAGSAGDAGAAGSAGQSGAPGALSGEYWLDVPTLSANPLRHIRINSATTALVSEPYAAELSLGITAPGVALSQTMSGTQPVLHGAFVLQGTNLQIALASDPKDGSTQALYAALISQGCPGTQSWQSGSGTVRRDVEPTVVEGFLPTILPWDPMLLESRKYAATALDASMQVTANGNPVALTYTSGNVAGSQSAVWATLVDGLSVVAQTLTFAGSVASTNGVASPIGPASVKVQDFGPPRAGALDFSATTPQALTSWNNPMHVAPGSACASGCLQINTGQGVALRLSNPGASLNIASSGGQITVTAYAAGGAHTSTTQTYLSPTTQNFPLPSAAEVFVAIAVPKGAPMQFSCPVFPNQTTYLTAVTPVP